MIEGELLRIEMFPAFPTTEPRGVGGGGMIEGVELLLVEIVELPVVSVSTFKVISPAGAVPLVSALIWEPFARLTV